MSKLYQALTVCIIGLLLWLWLIWLVTPVSAQVVINEVLPQPSSGGEWIELWNAGSSAEDLNGWSLWDQLSTPSLLTSWNGIILEPQMYLLVPVANKLNNSGDGVTLKHALGNTVDQMNYASSQPDLSWARQPDGGAAWVQTTTTAGAPNPIPSPTPSPVPTPILIPTPTPSTTPSPTPTATGLTEILPAQLSPCPSNGNQEWVSLTNTGELDIAEQTWKITDASGQTRLVITDLPAGQTTTLAWSGSLLNNSGDSIQVTSASNIVILSATVPVCSSAQVFSWINQEWKVATALQTTATATPSSTLATAKTSTHSPSPSGSELAETSTSLVAEDSNEVPAALPLTWTVPPTATLKQRLITLTAPVFPTHLLLWWLGGCGAWIALSLPTFRRLQQAYQYQVTEQMVQLFRANA